MQEHSCPKQSASQHEGDVGSLASSNTEANPVADDGKEVAGADPLSRTTVQVYVTSNLALA